MVGEIILSRDSGWTDRIRKYRILIDGQQAAEIANGQTIRLNVPPGPHTLQARIDWARTGVVSFNGEASDNVFQIRSNLRGWKVLLAGIYAFIPSRWIRLEKAD